MDGCCTHSIHDSPSIESTPSIDCHPGKCHQRGAEDNRNEEIDGAGVSVSDIIGNNSGNDSNAVEYDEKVEGLGKREANDLPCKGSEEEEREVHGPEVLR